eukprot:gene28310-31421_t
MPMLAYGPGGSDELPDAVQALAVDDEDDDSDDDEMWGAIKGQKARKKDAAKKKRSARMTSHLNQAKLKGTQQQQQVQEGEEASKKVVRGSGKLSPSDTGSGDEDEEEGDANDDDTIDAQLSPSDTGSGDEDEEERDANDDDTMDDDVEAAEGMSSSAVREPTPETLALLAKRPVVVCVVGEPNVGKSSTMNMLLGNHKVAVSSHPGRTKHYQTHYMTKNLMLCDCPGLVFPRLDVSMPMQVLFGSFPIAHVRDPYSVVEYLAGRVWPRLQVSLNLKKVVDEDEYNQPKAQTTKESSDGTCGPASAEDEPWSVEVMAPVVQQQQKKKKKKKMNPELCEAYAHKKNWRSRRGGRLDVFRAANWILRTALAGKYGMNLTFLPPLPDAE